MSGSLKQQARIQGAVEQEMRPFSELEALRQDYIETVEKPAEQLFDAMGKAMAEALYGPEIRRLQRLIEESVES